MPKVSIIVPNYNHARFLRERLDSIARQTFRDFEVILLDDASTDDSTQMLRAFAEQHRAQLVVNDQNSGNPFKQWNKGLRLAKGEYAWIAESDDYADPRFLEILARRLDEHPNCGVAYCNSTRVDDAGALHGLAMLDTHEKYLDHWRHDFVADGREECVRYLTQENVIHNASAVVFRRALYERIGGIDESFSVAGDWKFWADCLRIADVAFSAEPLNYFRTHQRSLRSRLRTWFKVEETLRIVKYIFERFDVPSAAVNEAHGRIAIVLLHALTVERPKRAEWQRCARLASELGLKLSLRASYSFSKQALKAIIRRLTGTSIHDPNRPNVLP